MSIDGYHQDDEDRVEEERHAGIVIKDGKLLLIHRIKEGFEYHVFPGGHRRRDESGEDAVIREIFEETGITVAEPKLAFDFSDPRNEWIHYYYICTWKNGDKLYLNGEEKDADPKVNFFDPMWIDLNEISNLNILPENAKKWVVGKVTNN